MLELNPESGLPMEAPWEKRAGIGSTDDVWRRVSRALVEPAQEIMGRPGKRFRAGLLELGHALVGNDDAIRDQRAFALSGQAIELLHAGSMIVDDVQDGSKIRRGGPAIHQMVGVPRAICAGNWLYFWPLRLIRDAGLPSEQEHAMIARYCDAVETAHYGQALDLTIKVEELAQGEVVALAREISALKTGAVTKLAVSLGAVLAGAPPGVVDRVARFGLDFGVVLQDLDDLGNLVGGLHPEKRFEDMIQGKASGVWAHVARRATPTEYAAFTATVAELRAGNAAALESWLAEHSVVATMKDEARQNLERVIGEAEAITPSSVRARADLNRLKEGLLHAYC